MDGSRENVWLQELKLDLQAIGWSERNVTVQMSLRIGEKIIAGFKSEVGSDGLMAIKCHIMGTMVLRGKEKAQWSRKERIGRND